MHVEFSTSGEEKLKVDLIVINFRTWGGETEGKLGREKGKTRTTAVSNFVEQLKVKCGGSIFSPISVLVRWWWNSNGDGGDRGNGSKSKTNIYRSCVVI